MATGPGPPANETNCSKPNLQQSAGQRSTQQQHPGEQPKHPISQSLIQPAITAAGQTYVESGHRYATNGASKGRKETRSTPIPTMNDRLSNVMAVIATLVPESSQLESGIQRVRHAHSEQVTASSQRSEQDERFNAARQAVESVKKLARENELLQKENKKLHSENQQLERLLSSAERLTQVCVDQRAKITKGEERIKEQELSIERQRASIEQKKADITEQEAKTAAYITWGETVRQHLASYPATSAPSTTRNLAQGSSNGEPSPLGLRSQSRSHPQQQSDRRERSRSPVREDRVFPARSPRHSGLRSKTTPRAPSHGSLPSNPRNNLPQLPSRPLPGSSRKSTPSSAKTHGQKPSMTGNSSRT